MAFLPMHALELVGEVESTYIQLSVIIVVWCFHDI